MFDILLLYLIKRNINFGNMPIMGAHESGERQTF